MSEKTSYLEVIEAEDYLLRSRREQLHGQGFADALDDNRFGIALSGGGIRSAIINLGFLKTLKKFGLFQQADYLSTVSGGGYTGAYIQATTREPGQDPFDKAHIDYMRTRGEYLFPGTGWYKIANQFTLVVAYLVSFAMSLISPAIVIALVGGLYFLASYHNLIAEPFAKTALAHWQWLKPYLLWGGLSLFVVHYLVNVSRVYKLDVSNWFNRMEAAIVMLAIATFIYPVALSVASISIPNIEHWINFIGIGVAIFLLGFFTNPNATSFHRYYRKQLADAFLHFAGSSSNIALHRLCDTSSTNKEDFEAPYPLINTCLNLQSSKDPNFQGAKASDYFLLSPLYCGAKLVGYVPTSDELGYKEMTLPAAVTISAAAVNPGMGAYSNKILSILLTILNLRLGFWTWNPLRVRKTRPIIWWPSYFFYELLGRIGTDKKMINISDGGHIENLGVIELLRRKCKLVLAIDAGADPFYTFSDLENLSIRARNELGIELRFRDDQIPEDVMRVRPSHGYSKKRFAVADIIQLWERVLDANGEESIEHYPGGKKTGLFVYVKSTVKAPTGRPEIPKDDYLKYGTYKYKIYHPEFPHESTADQFFDPVQWESYYQLGQFLASDVLGCDDLNNFDEEHALNIPLDELINRFETDMPLFGAVPIPTTRGRGMEAPMPAPVETEAEAPGEPTTYEM